MSVAVWQRWQAGALLVVCESVMKTVLTAQIQCRYVPLGLSEWFKGCGVQNVHELGWWQEVQHPGSPLTLACVPAQVSCCADQLFELADNSKIFPGSDSCSFETLLVIAIP